MCYNLRNFVNDSKEFSLQGMFINCLKIVVITPKVATYTSGEPSVDCSSRSTPVTTRNALPMSNTTDKRGHCGVSADQASKRQMNSDARVNAAEDPTAQTIRRWQPQTVHYHCAPGVTVVNAPGVTVKNFITAPAAAQAVAGVQEDPTAQAIQPVHHYYAPVTINNNNHFSLLSGMQLLTVCVRFVTK